MSQGKADYIAAKKAEAKALDAIKAKSHVEQTEFPRNGKKLLAKHKKKHFVEKVSAHKREDISTSRPK